MKISVLIAAYQAAPTLARALDSVCGQSYRDWEVIIVDDGSTDGTEALVAQYAGQIVPLFYERSAVNGGVAATRNRLLELATGEAYAFLDADDWWSEDHLANGVFEVNDGADLVVSGVETFDLASQARLAQVYPPSTLEISPVRTLFIESVIITSSSVLLTRTLAERVGRFDPRFRIGEDRDYWLRASLAGARIRLQRSPTCHYAKHAASSMGQTLLVTTQAVSFYEKYRSSTTLPPALRKQLLAHSLVNEARLLRRAQPGRSLLLLTRALWLDPRHAFNSLRRILLR